MDLLGLMRQLGGVPGRGGNEGGYSASNEENKAVLRRATERWNEGDLAGYLELYNPEVVLHGYQGVEPGLESV